MVITIQFSKFIKTKSMIPFVLGHKTFALPTRHGQLTLQQFLELRTAKEIDIIELVSILTRLSRAEILQISDVDIDYKLKPLLEFLNEPCDYNFPLPLFVEIEDKKFMIPDISRCTFGQKLCLETAYNKVAKINGNLFDVHSEALCIYFQPLIQNKEFHEGYMEVEKFILELPVEISNPVASFFLSSWKSYLSKKEKNSGANIPPIKSGRAFTTLKSLGLLQPFTALRNHLIKHLNKFSKWTIKLSLRLCSMRKSRQLTKTDLPK